MGLKKISCCRLLGGSTLQDSLTLRQWLWWRSQGLTISQRVNTKTHQNDFSRCGVKDVIGKVSGSRGKRYALQGELRLDSIGIWSFGSLNPRHTSGSICLWHTIDELLLYSICFSCTATSLSQAINVYSHNIKWTAVDFLSNMFLIYVSTQIVT